jgi:predicted nuclease of restriction endonuclease-like RecB superfamily
MIPDFRLVHPDGRSYLLEIVGYWRPEYLQKKFSQVRRAGCDNLILAISERLNLEKIDNKFNGKVWLVWELENYVNSWASILDNTRNHR